MEHQPFLFYFLSFHIIRIIILSFFHFNYFLCFLSYKKKKKKESIFILVKVDLCSPMDYGICQILYIGLY